MKEPKYILSIGGGEFAVPTDAGIATLIKMMEEAIPVHADLAKRQIELPYTDNDEDQYLRIVEMLREVKIRKIPAGVKWTRKTKAGEVQVVQVVTKRPKALPPPKHPQLNKGRAEAALPPRTPQLALGI